MTKEIIMAKEGKSASGEAKLLKNDTKKRSEERRVGKECL